MTEFCEDRYKNKRKSICKSCDNIRCKEYYNKKFSSPDGFEFRFRQWQKKAKDRNIPFELNLEDFVNIPRICHYTHQTLTLLPHKPTTISLDRLDNKKGYTKDNVVFCCSFVNYMKRELTYDQFIYTCHLIASIHGLPVG